MTVAEYFNKNTNELKFFTVGELRDELDVLCDRGLEDRIVLVPNPYPDLDNADYVLCKYGIDTVDGEGKCVYLDAFTFDENDKLCSALLL